MVEPRDTLKPAADLSVLMATYNHAPLLPRALDAILGQSVRPKEVIVVDDASTDNTAEILAGYARANSIVRVFRNDCNRGVNESSVRALRLASSGYVYFAGSDDCIRPGFVEKSMAILAQHPEAGLCCSYHSTLDGKTGEINANPSRWCDAPRYFSPAEVEKLVGHGAIAGHTSILKRSLVEAAGGYLLGLEWYSDFFLNLVIAFRAGLCHVPESLALFRVMPGTYSADASRSDKQRSVLNALIDQLRTPACADVVDSFRRSGVLSIFGASLVEAVANRPDVWSEDILGLVNCLNMAQYEELRESSDPAVRKLAYVMLGPFAHEIKNEINDLNTRCQRIGVQIDELNRLCRELQTENAQLAARVCQFDRVRSTGFWKVMALLLTCRRALLKKFNALKRGVAP